MKATRKRQLKFLARQAQELNLGYSNDQILHKIPMTKQEFWNVFDVLRPELEQLISGKSKDYTAYNTLSDMLQLFNEHLVPEITMDKEDRYILVISCDGFRQSVSALEQLTEGITEYANWKVVKYRQPGPMEFIPLNGQKVKRKNILLTWDKTSAGKYNLMFYLKWHLNTKIYQTRAILHLDHTIGEYDAMTKVEGVKFERLGLFQSKQGLKTLDDLKTNIDRTSEGK
jgi:hypothetical protein